MRVALDKPAFLQQKNKTSALSFTVITAEGDGHHQIIPRFRLMDGLIKPPAWKSQFGKWEPSYYASVEVAGLIYEALVETRWVEKYELTPLMARKLAIMYLLPDEKTLLKVSPCLA